VIGQNRAQCITNFVPETDIRWQNQWRSEYTLYLKNVQNDVHKDTLIKSVHYYQQTLKSMENKTMDSENQRKTKTGLLLPGKRLSLARHKIGKPEASLVQNDAFA
jgi:hypothetical protein